MQHCLCRIRVVQASIAELIRPGILSRWAFARGAGYGTRVVRWFSAAKKYK
jgi:hypothetical protein